MLRVNVGLSRKVSRDYQSTGYSINLDNEIPAAPNDPKAILDAIDHLYRLAEDALAREIDRDQGEQAQGRRDELPPANGDNRNPAPADAAPSGSERPRSGQDEAATNKQVQYLLSIGKRQNLSKPQLEERIEATLGRRLTVYQLSKREAGQVIDALTQEPANGRR